MHDRKSNSRSGFYRLANSNQIEIPRGAIAIWSGCLFN
ncbi:hypothetical protein P278_00910 [Zhouia amylolytica AD3]|uniref:Uncharacterized protein n=1 Tax=Zhouia amylolytica AD3 TaxID=1286632 RepID=W2UR71_9FLAO|nr:hypothetical protein P278_00910 [Zhouia amylolytica AD3]